MIRHTLDAYIQRMNAKAEFMTQFRNKAFTEAHGVSDLEVFTMGVIRSQIVDTLSDLCDIANMPEVLCVPVSVN